MNITFKCENCERISKYCQLTNGFTSFQDEIMWNLEYVIKKMNKYLVAADNDIDAMCDITYDTELFGHNMTVEFILNSSKNLNERIFKKVVKRFQQMQALKRYSFIWRQRHKR